MFLLCFIIVVKLTIDLQVDATRPHIVQTSCSIIAPFTLNINWKSWACAVRILQNPCNSRKCYVNSVVKLIVSLNPLQPHNSSIRKLMLLAFSINSHIGKLLYSVLQGFCKTQYQDLFSSHAKEAATTMLCS